MNTHTFFVRFFTATLILAGLVLGGVGIYDYRAEQVIRNLKDRYNQIEQLRTRVIQSDRERYQEIEQLDVFLHEQMESALGVEGSKAYLGRVLFISAMIFLLLSWLIILRLTRRHQQTLMHTNSQLSRRTVELDDLNRTLDQKVRERTESLSEALLNLQKTHQELQKAQAQLLQSEKFSAIGQLAAGIAHEINNPLGFINSNLQTLEKYVDHYTQLLGILNRLEKALKDGDKERAAEVVSSWQKIRKETDFEFIGGDVGNLLKESREGAAKISKIVYDLRAFASPDKGMSDYVNLELLMESMLNISWNELKYKAQIIKHFGNVPPIMCNPQKIGQVFVNLLINAAHAIPGKGFITIKTRETEEHVCIDVTDTGCGISPENITRIFDPFFTTKPAGRAVGLGLSISYDIVRRHGGTITFESEEGKGTTFTVLLPKAYACDGAQL